MKKNYQIPAIKVVHFDFQHPLLQVSGQVGGHATKPAKSRRRKGRGNHQDWDDEENEWDDEEDWDENDF